MGIYDEVEVEEVIYMTWDTADIFIDQIKEAVNGVSVKWNLPLDEINVNVCDSMIILTAYRKPTEKEVARRKAKEKKIKDRKLESDRKEYERLKRKFES